MVMVVMVVVVVILMVVVVVVMLVMVVVVLLVMVVVVMVVVKVVMVVVVIVVVVITFTMRMAALLRTNLSEGLSDNHQKKSDLNDRHANSLWKIFVPCFQVNTVFLNHSLSESEELIQQ